MTKAEFVDRLAGRQGLSKRAAAEAVGAVLDIIEEVLRQGGAVNFTGFGKFHVAYRGPRQGVNPRTGQRLTIQGRNVPRFTAGSTLKRAIKGH